MKRGRKILVIIILAFILPEAMAGQDRPETIPWQGRPLTMTGQERLADISSVTQNLLRYSETNPFEEIYLHTDRESYVAGETVRVKAWLFSYPDLRLSEKDSYAYVELLDYYGLPVAQITISLDKGSGESQMVLPDTLVTGSYLLRAYTSIGKNYLPYGCFMKKITVANPFRNKYLDFYTPLKYGNEQPYQVNFFPEGGSLVNGIPATIGLTVVNRYGYPVSCLASVTNERDEIIAEVVVDSTGISSFELMPVQGESYLFVPHSGGPGFEIPGATENGLTMRVTDAEGKTLRILLREKHNSNISFTGGGFILIQSRGRLIHSFKLPPWANEYEIKLPAEQLQEGLNNIALFDKQGNLVAERYIFMPVLVSGEEELHLNYDGAPGRREKISMEISGAGKPGKLTSGTVGSISVSASCSADKIVTAAEYLLLGSEFKHGGSDPELTASFQHLSLKARNIFLLGIKSVWIDWRTVADGSWDTPLFPEEINGRYLNVSPGTPQSITPGEELTAYLISWGKDQAFQYSESDVKGRFLFFMKKNIDASDIIIKIAGDKVSYPLQIESGFSERHVANSFTADTTSFAAVQTEIGKMTDRYQIGKIYGIADTIDKPAAIDGGKIYRSFYGTPDQEIILDDYISLSSMREIFFELVKRIQVRPDRKGAGLQIWDLILRRSPALFIDQVPVDDAATVLALDPTRVRQIDIISGDYLFGDIIFPGIVNVITRKGTFSDSRLPVNALRTAYSSHDRPLPFIMPDYSEEGSGKSRIPDFRNTLYWNGSLESDASGKFHCEFWTSDDLQGYDITVNAVDENGRPFSVRKRADF